MGLNGAGNEAGAFRFAPWVARVAWIVVAVIGAFTAFLGATIAMTQNDIKRVVAYSTVSQLGYMMLALGGGLWVSPIFHLITHAFFKAGLFLGSGSVIHGMHEEQDIRNMAGLRKYMPITFVTFLIASPEHPRAPEALLAIANSQAEMKDTRGARKTLEDLITAYPKSEAAVAGKERLASLK